MNDTFSLARPGTLTLAAANQAMMTRQHTSGWFFPGISSFLLVIVLAGFSPTLYLRAWTDVPAIPVHVMIHGIVMTTWFGLFVAQTALVSGRRPDLHRRLGIAATAVGVLVAILGLLTTLGFAARVAARADDLPQAALAGLSSIIWGNFAVLFMFVVLLARWNRVIRGGDVRHSRVRLL